MGREELGLEDGVHRRVARQDEEQQDHQGQGHPGRADPRQGAHDREGGQGPGAEGEDQGGLAADPVREQSEQGLDEHVDHQGAGADGGGRVLGEARGVDQELLHVGRVGVEGERARRGQDEDHRRLPGEAPEHLDGAQPLHPTGLGRQEGGALVDPPADDEDHHRQQATDHEGYAPAPGLQVRPGHHVLQDDQHGQGGQLAHDQGGELEARPEAAPGLAGHLRHVGGAGAVLAAERQALDQAGRHQADGRQGPPLRIVRQDGDGEGAGAHQRDRQGQGRPAASPVSIEAGQPGAKGPGQEAHPEDRRSLHQLGRRVPLGEEVRGEVEGKGGVGEPVVPLHQIAGGAAQYGPDAGQGRQDGRLRAGGRRGTRRGCGVGHLSPPPGLAVRPGRPCALESGRRWRAGRPCGR